MRGRICVSARISSEIIWHRVGFVRVGSFTISHRDINPGWLVALTEIGSYSEGLTQLVPSRFGLIWKSL